MSDETAAADTNARAAIAAALILSKAIDVSVVPFSNKVAAQESATLLKLKDAVDILMEAVIHK